MNKMLYSRHKQRKKKPERARTAKTQNTSLAFFEKNRRTNMEQTSKTPWGTTEGLYDPSFEHDNCGIGAIVNIKGTKTHQTVEDALKIVENLEHRAGKDAEGKTGDGVGILLQISHQFFSGVCKELGYDIGDERDYGIGMFFLPQNETDRRMSMKMFEIIAKKEGVTVLGWRMVPVTPGILGSKALDCMPCIMQCFLSVRHVWQRVLHLTASSMSSAVSSSSQMIIPMLFRFQAELSFTKECSLLDSFAISTTIYRMKLMFLQSRWFTPVSLQTQIQAGSVLIRTAIWYITVRSILSVAMWIRC